jgi:hypothetical protein
LEEEGRTGFIDTKGRMSSRHNYDNAGSYNEGMAWVELRGKVGFINNQGQEVVKPQYDYVSDFYKGVSIVIKKQNWGALDKTPKEIIPTVYAKVKRYSPDSTLLLVQNKQGKFGIYNYQGKQVLPEYFTKIGDYQNYNGQFLAPVFRLSNEVFFYIDEKGKCVEFDNKPCPEE